jgi:hypothetical protein
MSARFARGGSSVFCPLYFIRVYYEIRKSDDDDEDVLDKYWRINT